MGLISGGKPKWKNVASVALNRADLLGEDGKTNVMDESDRERTPQMPLSRV